MIVLIMLDGVSKNFDYGITKCARIGPYDLRKVKIRGLQPKCMNTVDPSSFPNGRDGRKPQRSNLKINYIKPTESVE